MLCTRVWFLCLISAVYVSAYDWTDPDFNIELQNDLLENSDIFEEDYIPAFRRRKREVRSETETTTECVPKESSSQSNGNNRYQRACCGDRDDLKMHGEALKEIRRECFADMKKLRSSKVKAKDDGPVDIFNCEKMKKSKEELVCVMECVAKKKKVVDADGKVLNEEMRSFVKSELVSQDWQKTIIDSVLDKCLNQKDSSNVTATAETNVTVVEGKRNDPEPKCNEASLKFSHCLWREMQLSCPKDMVRNTKACQRMRERLEKKENPDFSKNRNGIKHRRGKTNDED